MKVLSIGNSFSDDAHSWLHQIANSAGDDLYCVNLYIGGCPLERHYNNINLFISDNNERNYDLEVNGVFTGEKASINETLLHENWDVITLQQVSHLSGIKETFEPYLNYIYNYVKKAVPNAEIFWHETWAYEIDSTHSGFAEYGNNQKTMYERVKRVNTYFAEKYGMRIIPVGDAIQYARENISEFDYKNGGLSLNRDAFHLSNGYGRFIAGLVWYKTLMNADVTKVSFVPEGCDKSLTEKLCKIIAEIG